MPLKTIVKVSNISNLSDARYCAGMGVEMLGFGVIPGTDEFVSQEAFQDIRGWISGPKIIAELYGLADANQIASAIQSYAPDYFELSAEEYMRYGEFLTLPALVYLSGASELGKLPQNGGIRYLLIDENTPCNEALATGLAVLKKVGSVISLRESIDEGRCNGVVLQAPRELRPGITNYEQLGTFLEILDDDL